MVIGTQRMSIVIYFAKEMHLWHYVRVFLKARKTTELLAFTSPSLTKW